MKNHFRNLQAPVHRYLRNENLTECKNHGNLLKISHRGVNKMNKRTMKKMAKAKQQAAEAAKTAEIVQSVRISANSRKVTAGVLQ